MTLIPRMCDEKSIEYEVKCKGTSKPFSKVRVILTGLEFYWIGDGPVEQKRQKTVQFGDFHAGQSEVTVPDRAEQCDCMFPIFMEIKILFRDLP
ncbi:hypothetical protein DY000_02014837 [Brassica cretica]|uniref:Uncharacterized protein n=1 Tax=Brassica cretica TaxID=69181 RepID=A0ABQ7CW25_BRACR|nr:hypothetical protein DY000_02014837 [Brassica cretica]